MGCVLQEVATAVLMSQRYQKVNYLTWGCDSCPRVFRKPALNSRWPGTLICITAHAMSDSVVNDLAKAMKALDGKKKSSGFQKAGSR